MTLLNAQDPFSPVDFPGYNTSGATIPAFSAVRMEGAASHPDLGEFATIGLAKANLSTGMPCVGITTGDIENGNVGTVRTWGIISDIDTSAFSDGDPLYVSEITAGLLQVSANPPIGITQRVGHVLVSDATVGSVFVYIDPQMDGETSYTNRDQFIVCSPTTATSAIGLSATGGAISLVATPTGVRNLTLPDATDTLVGRNTTDTLTNKDFPDNELRIQSSGDATKRMVIRNTETPTADERRLSIILNDASRTLTIPANATVSGTNTGDQTITLTGDVTGTGTGSFAATIANDAVTYAKMQNVSATDRLLGRSTAGAGDVEEITCTSFARSLLDDSTAAAALATLGLTQLMDTSGRCVRSTLPNANTGFAMTSGTAYFVYLGRVLVTSTFAFVRFACRTGGSGAQTAEVGFFSSSTAPSRANQSLTKLAATGTVDDLTTTGVKGNTATLAISVAAGTHLWAGIRTAMATTQPSLYGLIADRSHGRILSTAAAGALTGAGPWTGALITDAGTTLAPDLEGALD